MILKILIALVILIAVCFYALIKEAEMMDEEDLLQEEINRKQKSQKPETETAVNQINQELVVEHHADGCQTILGMITTDDKGSKSYKKL